MPTVLDYAFAPAWAREQDARSQAAQDKALAYQQRMSYLDELLGPKPEDPQTARMKQLLGAPSSMPQLQQLGAQQLNQQWFPQAPEPVKMELKEDAQGRKWWVDPYTQQRKPFTPDDVYGRQQALLASQSAEEPPISQKDLMGVYSKHDAAKEYRDRYGTVNDVNEMLSRGTSKADTAAVTLYAKAISGGGTLSDDDVARVAKAEGGLLGHLYSQLQEKKDGKLSDQDRAALRDAVDALLAQSSGRLYEYQQRLNPQLEKYGYSPDLFYSGTGTMSAPANQPVRSADAIAPKTQRTAPPLIASPQAGAYTGGGRSRAARNRVQPQAETPTVTDADFQRWIDAGYIK